MSDEGPFDPYDPHPALRLLHVRNRHNKLFHFFKGTIEQAIDAAASVLVSRRLRGGSGFIRDGYRCVCLGELPLTQLSQYLADPNAVDQQYKPLGIIVDKHWLFRRGGRPVIYQPRDEYERLPTELRHLHMPYDPDVEYDFSWIREWRIKCDELDLDLDHATAVFPTRAIERRVIDRYRQRCRAAARPPEFDWHSVVLADLGIPVIESEL